MKKQLVASAFIVSLLAGAPYAMADEWDSLAFGDEIKAAHKEIDKAKAVGFEWRDSRKMLKEAQKVAKSGDMDKARKLVAKAVKQSADAVAQAKLQANAGPH